jgi:hypothetical protein
MTTAIAKASNQELPAFIQTPLYAQSLPPQERLKHRAWVGVRIEALLDGYWSSRPSEAVKSEILGDWMDALENFTPDEIRAGCRQYLDGPNRDRKPKTGDIVELLVAKRTDIRRSLPKPPEPPSPALSVPVEERRKQAEQILKSFGYRHAD